MPQENDSQADKPFEIDFRSPRKYEPMFIDYVEIQRVSDEIDAEIREKIRLDINNKKQITEK